MPKKKPLKGKPEVHPELEGLDIRINPFGEIEGEFDLDHINRFLDETLYDKKLTKKQKESRRKKLEKQKKKESKSDGRKNKKSKRKK